MKKSILGIVVLAALSGSTLFGQDLVGQWQGTLTTPTAPLRIVARITKATDGKLEGQIFSIDQAGPGRPINVISQDGRNLKWKIDALGASYEGNFTADGNTINGALTQANTTPLTLVRATPQTAWAIPEPPPVPKPMDPAADPGIEVATVKPSPVETRGRGIGFQGQQLRVNNYTVHNAIAFAYGLHERQISGGPAWLSADRFEIVVKSDTPGQPNPQQIRRLIQKVLTERFQLQFHREKQELSVYTITAPANTKHKLTESAAGGNLPTLRFPRPGLLPARNATMAGLAQALQGAVLDRPVVDLTKIEGKFDFTLDWTPDEFQFGSFGAPPQVPDAGKPNIFQAFQEQLGLKLEATKAPADVFVIDKVDKPSDN
jgi:uncharacterized protein (TIGR03435 family)